MASTVANIDKVLKELYIDQVVSTVNNRRVLLTRLERDTMSRDISGRYARFPVNIRPSEAIGARGDDESLPTPQNQVFVDVQIPYKYNYATIRITLPAIEASKSNAGSFIRALTAEMDGIRRDLRNDFNRQFFLDGSGFLGQLNGTANSATQTLDAGHYVKPNMVIDIWSAKSGGTKNHDSATVSSVTSTTMVLSASIDTTGQDNTFVMREDVKTASANYEMMGLQGIVDSGQASEGADGPYVETLFNISRDTYTEWRAQVHHNSGTGRAVTEALIDALLDDIHHIGEGETDLIVCSPAKWRTIGALFTGERRYNVTQNDTRRGGFNAIQWSNGIEVIADPDCPQDSDGDHQIYALDTGSLKIYELAGIKFDDKDGNVLHRNEGKASYDATLYWYANLGCDNPGRNGVLRDIS